MCNVAKDAAKYPRALCQAVLRGLTRQMKADGRLRRRCYGLQAQVEEEEDLKHIYGPAQGYSGRYKDDISGQVLRDDLVKTAQAVELEFFSSKGVWKKVDRVNA